MMTHYYHFHQQNSPSSYHHRNMRNEGSLIYLEQFQNYPIGIPKMMKMHLWVPRTPCFRENSSLASHPTNLTVMVRVRVRGIFQSYSEFLAHISVCYLLNFFPNFDFGWFCPYPKSGEFARILSMHVFQIGSI